MRISYELCNWLKKSLENQQKYLIVCELVDCNIAVFLHWLTTDWPSIESSRSECEIRNRSRLWIDAVGSRCLDFGGKNPTVFATRGSSICTKFWYQIRFSRRFVLFTTLGFWKSARHIECWQRKDFFQVIRRPRGCNWMWISLTQLIHNLIQNRRKTKWDLIC